MIIVLSDDAMLDGKDDLVDEERDRGEDEFELGERNESRSARKTVDIAVRVDRVVGVGGDRRHSDCIGRSSRVLSAATVVRRRCGRSSGRHVFRDCRRRCA